MDFEVDDSLQNTDTQQQRPKRPKRPTKSVNETLEPAFTPPSAVFQDKAQNQLIHEAGSGLRAGAEEDILRHG